MGVSTFRPQRIRPGDRLGHSYINRVAQAGLQRITLRGGRAQHIGNSVAIQIDDERGVFKSVKWPGVITASALQTGHDARWDYTVKKIKYTDTDATSGNTVLGYEILTGDDALSVTAWNTIELAHIADPGSGNWYVWGVDKYGDDYPGGFEPLPVGGGGANGTHKVDLPIEITERVIPSNTDNQNDPVSTTIYTFEAMGSHDGTCT